MGRGIPQAFSWKGRCRSYPCRYWSMVGIIFPNRVIIILLVSEDFCHTKLPRTQMFSRRMWIQSVDQWRPQGINEGKSTNKDSLWAVIHVLCEVCTSKLIMKDALWTSKPYIKWLIHPGGHLTGEMVTFIDNRKWLPQNIPHNDGINSGVKVILAYERNIAHTIGQCQLIPLIPQLHKLINFATAHLFLRKQEVCDLELSTVEKRQIAIACISTISHQEKCILIWEHLRSPENTLSDALRSLRCFSLRDYKSALSEVKSWPVTTKTQPPSHWIFTKTLLYTPIDYRIHILQK